MPRRGRPGHSCRVLVPCSQHAEYRRGMESALPAWSRSSMLAVVALTACGTGSNASEGKPTVPSPVSSPGPAAVFSPAGVAAELFSEPVEYRARPVSVDAGRTYFMETGVGDPYAAGIAYPLFLALQQTYPARLGRNWNEFNRKFGTIPNPKTPNDPTALPVGFHLTTDPNTGVKFLMMNCQVCHTARLRLPGGDKVVSGLGNKRLRIHSYARALMDIGADRRLDGDRLVSVATRLAARRSLRWPRLYAGPIVANTLGELRRRSKVVGPDLQRLGAELPGRVATVSGFSMALNVRYHTRLAMPKTPGWVKIPDVAVWRYRDTNSFDGMVLGSPVTLIAEADFAFGVRPRWYETHRHIPTSIFLFMKSFERDLPYPGTIDPTLAREGYRVFNRACAKCHGRYAPPGTPPAQRFVLYKERLISIDQVDTDAARLDAVTPAFLQAANAPAATRGLTHARATRAYVPRPLINVWARGLYGHNGQWPSLHVLAMPPDKRPRTFIVQPDATYDLVRLGTRWRPHEPGKPLASGEYLYDGTRPGFLVKGHEFLSKLPAQNRRAVLEYLKTL